MKRGRPANYGPDLTQAQEQALKEEIKNFDVEATRREIAAAAVGGPSTEIAEFADDMDKYREDQAMSFDRPALDKQIEMAKFEINEILSFRQRQVWRMVMRQGLTYEQTAEKMNISAQAVAQYLKVATNKVTKHFSGGK